MSSIFIINVGFSDGSSGGDDTVVATKIINKRKETQMFVKILQTMVTVRV